MKRTLTAIACVLAVGLTATEARATDLTVGDAYYVGLIKDAIPSNPANAVTYINNLLTLAPNQGTTTIGTETYNRVSSSLASPLPSASWGTQGYLNTGIAVSGFTYILAKYDAEQGGGYVWYVPSLTVVSVPSYLPGPEPGKFGFSHYTLIAAAVPDGGATLMLLGSALVGLGAIRRRFNR